MDDYSSTKALFKEIIPCSKLQFSIVHGYVSMVGFNLSNFKALRHVKKMCDDDWYRRLRFWDDVNFVQVVASLTQEVQEVFVVPKFQLEKHQQKHEILAGFIHFLLQLLHGETDRINSFRDQIELLKKELRFLTTFLVDEVLQLSGGEAEQVGNVLGEVETVANKAGRVVYSFIFAVDELFVARRIHKAFVALLEHFHLLKANIKFLIMLPNIYKANVYRSIAHVNLLSIDNYLLYDLENLMNCEDKRILDVRGLIKLLRQRLVLLQFFFKDVNLPRNLEIQEVKETVMRISDATYEAEYLINSCLFGDAPLWYLTIRLSHVIQKIELIGTGLQEIKKNYDSEALEAARDLGAQLSLEANVYSEVDGITVGLEDKAIDILDQLVGGAEHLQIVSIFGMPGIGKTTFAKKLYKHPSVMYYFDKCSWCVISQTYHRKSILIDILIGLGSALGKVRMWKMEEDSLVENIYKSLKGHRYLIVMDDIWDLSVWDDLRICFPNDRNGSRILLTSRNKDAAPPSSIIYALPSLSNDQSWELLEKRLFHDKPCPPQLLGIGKKIAANCHGLPLAIVVVAGILSTIGKEESTWRSVGASLNSYIFSDQNNAMMQILELSYEHLPAHLKPCFLYFGAFSEDQVIHVQKLKRLWIAEGFIRKEENKSIENIAEEYLVELINKSLLIVAERRSDGGTKACVVHDLLHDLCLRIAEKENFLKVISNDFSMYTKHHRLYVPFQECHMGPFGCHVRSMFGSLRHALLCIRRMRLLRVLELPNSSLNNLGDGFECLIHLRYLYVASMLVSDLGYLLNLEFLTLTSFSPRTGGIIFQPRLSTILKMVKLKYLNAGSVVFAQDYYNSPRTNNLEFLSTIFIETLKDLEMLKCSPHLRKLKCHCVAFVGTWGAYQYPDIRFLTQLESLNMASSSSISLAYSRVIYPAYSPFIYPASSSICMNPDINLPSSIKKLTLSGLKLRWEKMSIIGELPNLQVLKLGYQAFVGEIWDTRDGEFQQLIFLKLSQLDIAQWNVPSGEHFPKLQQLILYACHELQEIPCEIGEIATLQLIEVNRCGEAVAESARKIQQEQVDMGIEDLEVIIGDIDRENRK